jgi:hypothetical protein
MILFNKDKDFIHKITNFVLLLWLIGSFVFLYTTIVNLIIPRPLMNYDDYKVYNCYLSDAKEDIGNNDYCQTQYEQYKIFNKQNNYNDKRALFISAGSIIIVSTALYLLNKKKKRGDK